MEIEKFHTALITHTEKLYNLNKEVPTACFALLPNDNVIILTRPFADNEGKEHTIRMYSMMITALNAQMYAFACEYYFYQTTKMDNPIAPSQHPDRREGLGVFTTSKTGEKLFYNVEIKDHEIIHDKSKVDNEFDGRFSNLFIELDDKTHKKLLRDSHVFYELIQLIDWANEIPKEEFFDIRVQ